MPVARVLEMSRLEPLALAVRGSVVLRYVGELLVGVGLMVAVPAVFALAAGHHAFAARAAFMVVVVAVFGVFFRRYPAPSDLQVNESLVVVAVTFLAGAAVMVLPLMADDIGPWDAFFEAVSALTTTGLTTIVHVEARSSAFQFARAWMQWCGGFFIVVLALALIVEPSPAARRLFGSEGNGEPPLESTRRRARQVLGIYVLLLGGGVLLLMVCGLAPFDALLHALTSISTGGFSSHDASIAAFGPRARAGVIALAVCGAVPIALYGTAWRKGWQSLARHQEVGVLLLMGVAASFVMMSVLMTADHRSLAESVVLAPLLAFSAQTTSGFEATRVADLSAAARACLLLPMFIGGGLGSTAGGIKISRAVQMVRAMTSLLDRARMPRHAVVEPTPVDALAMLGLVFLFVCVIVVSWLSLLFLHVPPLDSLFEVVSAVGTVGLSSGVTGPELPTFGKVVLCLDMLAGRLEIVAILLLFDPRTWIGRKASTQ